MTATDSSPVQAPHRLPFAAKYHHRGWGIALAVIAVSAFFNIFGAIGSTDPDAAGPGAYVVFFLACAAGSVYLLRGRGVSPRAAARRADASRRREEVAARNAAMAAASLDQAKAALLGARGGAAVVAYRNLEATIQRSYPQDVPGKLAEALADIAFDMTTVSSPRYGVVHAIGGGAVEIFRDWIIFGQEAHDVEPSTRGQVYVDGAIQMTSTVVLDKKNRQQVVNQQHDLRTAQLQFTSASWSMGVGIDLDSVNDARRLVEQLAGHLQTLQPRSATTADIQEMVRAILDANGQPPAEKLQQLSNLRYERLLSDDEFEKAKSRILGI